MYESESKPRPELELSFDTEPIIAWRVWNVRPYDHHGGTREHRLSALASGTVWPPRERMEASCNTGAHDAPWAECHCGAWAVRTRDEAYALARAPGRVFGEVALWGRVLEFDKGYRAQFAYPQRLYFYKDLDLRVVEALRRVYGCEIELLVEARPYTGLIPSSPGHVVTSPIVVHFTGSWTSGTPGPQAKS